MITILPYWSPKILSRVLYVPMKKECPEFVRNLSKNQLYKFRTFPLSEKCSRKWSFPDVVICPEFVRNSSKSGICPENWSAIIFWNIFRTMKMSGICLLICWTIITFTIQLFAIYISIIDSIFGCSSILISMYSEVINTSFAQFAFF